MHLVTGGAGFIGSHLVDRLVAGGDSVVVLDNLSTGRLENLEHAIDSGRVQFVHGTTNDASLVESLMRDVARCWHLASAVGVKLITEDPLRTLRESVRGADVVISTAAELDKRLVFTSTSEIYGKRSRGKLSEVDDRIVGCPQLSRWSYSTAKVFGESLVYGFARERGADMRVARLFNTVGPRQAGQYGMVLPTFVRQALAGQDVTVYGDGSQSRCFAHVADTVWALVQIMDLERAGGEVFNIGSESEVSILGLARRVLDRTGSRSRIRLVPYAEAYDEGFEELGRRQPDTAKLRAMTGWAPRFTVDDAIDHSVAHERATHPTVGTQAATAEDASISLASIDGFPLPGLGYT